MKSSSAAFQKLQKLEFTDCDDLEIEVPMPSYLEEISKIVSCFHYAMCSAKLIAYSAPPEPSSLSDSIQCLKILVESLCKVLNYSNISEVSLPKPYEKNQTYSVVNRMLKAPAEGIYLKQTECKEICSLIFGDVRDVEHNALKEKVMKSQQQIVKYAKNIHELHAKLEDKEKELIRVYDNIDKINEEISKSLVQKYKSPKSKLQLDSRGDSTCASININC